MPEPEFKSNLHLFHQQQINEMLVEQLQKGYPVKFTFYGHSMLPFFWAGDHVTIEPYKGKTPQNGDIVAYFSDYYLTCHRIIDSKNSNNQPEYLIKGDNCLSDDGWFKGEDLLGKVVVWHKGPVKINLNKKSSQLLNRGMYQFVKHVYPYSKDTFRTAFKSILFLRAKILTNNYLANRFPDYNPDNFRVSLINSTNYHLLIKYEIRRKRIIDQQYQDWLQENLFTNKVLIFLLHKDEKVIGSAYLSKIPNKNSLCLDTVWIDPFYQYLGIEEKLLSGVDKYAKENGLKEI